MATVSSSPLELASISLEWSRPPLSPVTNSPPQTPTPAQSKKVRRKSSLICRADSSEELTSSHESIFHAKRFSNSNSESNDVSFFSTTTLNPTIRPITSVDLVGNNENIRNQLLAPMKGGTPILYGHGTALSTIVEQKSSTTMSTRVSSAPLESTPEASVQKISISNILGHRNSFDLPSTVTLRSPRRRRSFSVDDLYFIKRSYHDACTVIEREINGTFSGCNIYAEPRTPILPPINRSNTPPGMPSWTDAQSIPVQNGSQQQRVSAARTHNSFQRFCRIWSSPSDISCHSSIPVALQSSDQSTPSTLPPVVPPRFRPIRSGHVMGPLESHPFHRGAHADVKSDVFPAPPRIAPSNCPSAWQRAAKTKSRASTRPRKFPNVMGRARMSASITSRSNNTRRGRDMQCPHRQGCVVPLRVPKQHAPTAVPDPNLQVANVVRPVFGGPEENPVYQPITLTAARQHQNTVITRSAVVSPRIPTATNATASPNPNSNIPTGENASQIQKCWKCRVFGIFRAIDTFWDEATALLCGIFCCIDVDGNDLES